MYAYYLYKTTYHELVDDTSLSDTGTEIKKKLHSHIKMIASLIEE